LLVDLTKTEIEKQLIQSENKNKILNDRVQILEGQMKKILGLVKRGKLVVSSIQ
jgi:hypothetical protein